MNPIVWTSYCGPAPSPLEWVARWNTDPLALGLALLPLAALGVVRTTRARIALAAASAALFVSFVSPLCALSSALFSARTLHHLLLMSVAAPLLALALPRARTSHLLVATVVQAVTLWVWHAPSAYAAALSSDAVYWTMQASLLASALIFWRALRAASGPSAIIALLATMMAMGLLGALLTFAGQAVYAPHAWTTAAWGLTPLEDQQTAGLIMWAPASALYLAAALWRLGRMLPGDETVRAS